MDKRFDVIKNFWTKWRLSGLKTNGYMRLMAARHIPVLIRMVDELRALETQTKPGKGKAQ